jgi:hypothetical protein
MRECRARSPRRHSRPEIAPLASYVRDAREVLQGTRRIALREAQPGAALEQLARGRHLIHRPAVKALGGERRVGGVQLSALDLDRYE